LPTRKIPFNPNGERMGPRQRLSSTVQAISTKLPRVSSLSSSHVVRMIVTSRVKMSGIGSSNSLWQTTI